MYSHVIDVEVVVLRLPVLEVVVKDLNDFLAFRGLVGHPVFLGALGDADGLGVVVHDVIEEHTLVEHEAELGLLGLAQLGGECDGLLLVRLGLLLPAVVGVDLGHLAGLVGLGLLQEHGVLHVLGEGG